MYTPISQAVYDAAFSAVLGGILNSRYTLNTTAANYDHVTKVAGAVAEEVDTRLSVITPTAIQLQALSAVIGNEIASRLPSDPFSEVAATYQNIADSIIAVLTQMAVFYTANIDQVPYTPNATTHTYVGYYQHPVAIYAISAATLKSWNEQDKIWAVCFLDSYTWNPQSTAVDDGMLVINPTANIGNPGRLIRDCIANQVWGSQTAWYIDPVGGNDRNNGLTLPLKTGAELGRRTFNTVIGVPNGTLNIYILNDILSPDVFRLVGRQAYNCLPIIHGSATPGAGNAIVYSGTMTARTLIAPATNVPPDITDAGVPTGTWAGAGLICNTTYPNIRLRLTSGANIGATAFPIKDLGAGKVRCTQWLNQAAYVLAGGSTYIPLCDPAGNETFVVENLVQIQRFEINLSGNTSAAWNANPGFNAGIIEGISFWKNNSTTEWSSGYLGDNFGTGGVPLTWNFVGCSGMYFGPRILGRTSFAYGCSHKGMNLPSGCWLQLSAGVILASCSNRYGSQTQFDGNVIAQGVGLLTGSRGGYHYLGAVGVFDVTGDAITVTYPATANIATSNYGAGTQRLWGSGSTGVGLTIQNGSVVPATGNAPVITGTGGDFKLDNVAAGTGVRALDNATGLFTAAIPTTWANWVAAAPAGFNFCARNHLTGSGLVRG